jgi:hypothetical protein
MYETSPLEHPAHALQPAKLWSKSVINEGHFTRDRNSFLSLSHLVLQRYNWPKRYNWLLPPMRYKQCKCCRKLSAVKGILLKRPKQFLAPISPRIVATRLKRHIWHPWPASSVSFVEIGRKWRALDSWGRKFFVPISPRIAAGWMECNTWHSLLIRYNQSEFGTNRYVVKDTLLVKPKQYFFPISPRVTAGWLKRHIWNSPPSCYKRRKFCQNQYVMKGTYSSGLLSFTPLFRPALQRDERNVTPSNATTSETLVKIGQ